MEREKQEFLKAIAADRYDQTSRLVFADWLEERGLDDEAMVQRRWTPEIQRAEDWMREFSAEHGIAYEDFLAAGTHYLDEGIELDISMDASNAMWDCGQMQPGSYGDGTEPWLRKYWQYWELVTGRSMEKSDRLPDPFNCACI